MTSAMNNTETREAPTGRFSNAVAKSSHHGTASLFKNRYLTHMNRAQIVPIA